MKKNTRVIFSGQVKRIAISANTLPEPWVKTTTSILIVVGIVGPVVAIVAGALAHSWPTESTVLDCCGTNKCTRECMSADDLPSHYNAIQGEPQWAIERKYNEWTRLCHSETKCVIHSIILIISISVVLSRYFVGHRPHYLLGPKYKKTPFSPVSVSLPPVRFVFAHLTFSHSYNIQNE